MARPEGEGSVAAEQTARATSQKEGSCGFWGSIIKLIRSIFGVFLRKPEAPTVSEESPNAEVAVVTLAPTEKPDEDMHATTDATKPDNEEAVLAAEPVVEPTANPSGVSFVQPAEEPAGEPVVEVATKTAAEPVVQPAEEPVVEAAAKPTEEPKGPEIAPSSGAPASSPEVSVLSPEGNQSSVPVTPLSTDEPDEKQAATFTEIVAPPPAAETETKKPEEAVELKANESVSEPSAAASVDQSTAVNSDNIEPDAKLNEVSDNISIDG